jgi:hypothetical protein
LKLGDHDPVAAVYAEECQRLIDAPPQSWEGVWVMNTK